MERLPNWSAAARRVARADWEAFSAQLEANGGCAQPVRLRGSVLSVHRDTGEATLAFSSSGLPKGVLLKACGCRRATRCASCAAIYRGDAKAIVLAGLVGGKGIDEGVAGRPAAFLTLTAPSFGAVHGTGNPCRHGWGRCPHGVAHWCSLVHGLGDDVVGSALCPDCYDYEAAVIWNAGVGELWRRTVIAITRALAAELGVPVRSAAEVFRVSFVKVVEFQRRGVVHIHAVLRLDGDAGTLDLLGAIEAALAKVSAPNPWPAGMALSWGTEHDLVPLSGDQGRKVAGYLAKYATKSTDEGGALDRRLTEGALSTLELPPQLARMVEAAWRLGAEPVLSHLRLRAWAHTLGYRGHWVTKSRGWSTTFRALRDERYRWRLERDDRGLDGGGDEVQVGDWSYTGIGYADEGEELMAGALAESRRRSRRTAWEER